MDDFRTIIYLKKHEEQISYKNNIMILGSCFTENIGVKLQNLLLKTDINPFGVIYNPISVANSLQILINKKAFINSDLKQNNELWFSFFHHGRFSNTNKNRCLKNINERIKTSSNFLNKTDYLFITFGTAWTYELKETGKVVSNCHKLPKTNFKRKLLSVEEIVVEYQNLIKELKNYNPNIKIVFTISPVRHLKDGVEQNNLSKSILKIAVNKLVENNNISYFPAYEIMMDDLRDYRFYDNDMLHPNLLAINYIWNKFSDVFFNNETLGIITEIEKLIKAKEHRPYNPKSKNHQKFIETQLKKIKVLNQKYSFIDTGIFESYFKEQIV